MTKKSEILRCIFMTFVVLAMNSCHDDGEKMNTTQIRGSVVGEWLDDASSGSEKLFTTEKYNENGTLEMLYVYINKTHNSYDFYEGSYTIDNNTLKQNFDYENGPETVSYEIQYMDGYSLTYYDAEQGFVSSLKRIIDTYEMTIGEERVFVIEDMDFDPIEYTTLDPSIATIDDDGMIHAVKRGMTFVTATSKIGTVVIRINVNDPENVIDDFACLIGASIEDVKNIYGTNFIDVYNGVTAERNYNFFDDYVEHGVFMYFARKIQNITVYLRDYADISAIYESYRQKYDSYNNSTNMFVTKTDGVDILIFLDPLDKSIIFMPLKEPQTDPEEEHIFSDESYQQFESLINMTAEQAAKELNHEITEEEWLDGSFDVDVEGNDIFDMVSVLFDEDEEIPEVGTVILRCKKDVSQEDIEPWYKEHHQSTGDEINPYCSEGETYYIRFKKSGSRINVYYSKRKAKK